ncbi:hypothetical protein [Chitinophaga qingshengii]|uniref:Uncharacterized protein n=1 Tax=Chitinophaga qingshengii TaxID=1569794 RepID=A0ABR7TFB7_9BACT|nr:hypothetical protein [Chitinophaga qingshengii]MBC9929030.1 hypothetical protein [Chitinophaga qingshengii]
MKKSKTIQLKAIFLLIVFSLNTLVGFACAVGLNMGFPSKHHHDEGAITPVLTTHYHREATHHHGKEIAKAGKAADDDNCCNNNVIEFSQLDKLLAHTVDSGIETPVVLVHLHFFYQSYLPYFTQSREQAPVLRPYISSSRGIRVSIQSFQI